MAKNKAKKEPVDSPLLIDGTTASSLPATRLVTRSDGVEQVPARYPWGWRARDEVQVAASWRRQILILRIGGVRVRFQACLDEDAFGGVAGDQSAGATDDDVEEAAARWPLAAELIAVGSIPGASPSFPGEATARLAALRDSLRTYGVDTLPATLVDRSHAWTEPALVAVGYAADVGMTGDWQARVLIHARQYGFDHAVRVRDGKWQVLRLTAPQVGVETTDPCSITRDVDHHCPMLRAPAQGEYCRMVGGPYGSRAIHAAASWKRQQDDLVGVLGCDTCEGTRYRFQGRIVTGGGPIAISESPLPSRWLAADDVRLLDGEAGDE